MLKNDIKRAVFSIGMLLSVAIGIILLLQPEWYRLRFILFPDPKRPMLNKSEYINCIYSSLVGGGFLIFTPLLTVLPSVTKFCDDYNTGYIKSIIIRKKRSNYIANRLISNAIAGGIATALPLIVFTIYALLTCRPYNRLTDGKSPLTDTILGLYELIWGGLLSILIIILFAFLFGVVWSTVGLAVSAIYPNRYLSLCFPFLLFYFLHILLNALNLPLYSPVNLLLPDIVPSMLFPILYQLILLAVFTIIYVYFARRRIMNV